MLNEEIGTGLEAYSWLRAIGFENYELPLIVGPDSVYLGNNVVRALFQRDMIEIDEENALPLIEAIPAYKLPVDRRTQEITSNKPVHNMASHPCDSFRYAVTSVWTADDLPFDGFFSEAAVRAISRREQERKGGRIVDGSVQPDATQDDEGGLFAPVFAGTENVF
jgi:hypothetical protein